MTNKAEATPAARMSDSAVQAKTGRTWSEWFAILDAAGAAQMNHQQIVAYLSNEQGVGPWWQQMLTVAYEQERGLREKHQRPDGYQISVSKTIGVSVERLYAAWEDPVARTRWLPGAELTIRKATPGRSLRVSWADGTRVDVMFTPKGDAKCALSLQHGRLPDAEAAARMKAYWAAALDQLKRSLEA